MKELTIKEALKEGYTKYCLANYQNENWQAQFEDNYDYDDDENYKF